jgi:hypothetical protein
MNRVLMKERKMINEGINNAATEAPDRIVKQQTFLEETYDFAATLNAKAESLLNRMEGINARAFGAAPPREVAKPAGEAAGVASDIKNTLLMVNDTLELLNQEISRAEGIV